MALTSLASFSIKVGIAPCVYTALMPVHTRIPAEFNARLELV
jgi:hypothetical protein